MVTTGWARPSNQSCEVRFKELWYFHQVCRPTILLSVISPVFKLYQDFPVCWWWNVQRHHESNRDHLPTSCRRLWPAWKVMNDEEDISVVNKQVLVCVRKLYICSYDILCALDHCTLFLKWTVKIQIYLKPFGKKKIILKCQVNGNDSVLTGRFNVWIGNHKLWNGRSFFGSGGGRENHAYDTVKTRIKERVD